MQAIKYKWSLNGDAQPSLFAKDSDVIKRIALLGEHVSFTLGAKRCIGFFRNGRHLDCPEARIIEHGWNCNQCRFEDDFFLCMKCTGAECINEKQRPACIENMYYIYLAAFDSILKVGISHERRLMERLVEQGADFGAKIACVKDGKDVRLIEQEISRYLNIADKVTGATKQSKIFGNPNIAVTNISRAISRLQSNGVSKYLIPPEIYDLRSYYKLDAVGHDPLKVFVKEGSRIEGEVVAAKGNIIVMSSDSGGSNNAFFSINAHELIGREMMMN